MSGKVYQNEKNVKVLYIFQQNGLRIKINLSKMDKIFGYMEKNVKELIYQRLQLVLSLLAMSRSASSLLK